ncbi:MAG: hypothetical protein ACR2FN_01960 [Chitinophagaceae bacterium]
MERIGALISKLHEQYQQGAGAEAIAITAQMLLAELQNKNSNINNSSKKVSVVMPSVNMSSANGSAETNAAKELQKETQQIKIPAEKNGNYLKKDEKINWMFDGGEEIPTLAHQNKNKRSDDFNQRIAANEESLNEKLRIEKIELGTILKDSPIRDLKKAIGINDRYLFIDELFRGDENMYERSIKTINSFTIFPEADYWIKRELKLKLGWNENSETVVHFDQLVKRRFS